MHDLEKDALERLQVIEEQILLITHKDYVSPELIDAMFEKSRHMCEDWKQLFTIVSLPKGLAIPKDVREAVHRNLAEYEGRLLHIAIVAETHTVLTLAFRLIAALRPYWKYSLHKTVAEALARVRQVKNESKREI